MTTKTPENNAQQVRCPECNGTMEFDASIQKLKCVYCKHTMEAIGHAVAKPAGSVGTGPREIPISEGLSRAPKGFGTDLRAVECKSCGATINLGPNDQTAACTYCASTMVMPKETDPNVITPESLVPFRVEKKAAGDLFQNWMKGLWFRPNNLRRMAKLEQIAGVYVPFWTFDALVYSQWSAERGWHYYETETYTEVENGQTVRRERRVQKTRWEPASGSRSDMHDDTLVCGSRAIPPDLVAQFRSFDTRALVPYAPSYLAGWRAESYSIDLNAAWQTGRSMMEDVQRQRCSGDVGGDTHRSLTVSNHFQKETFKHVLLPVYVAAYRYQDKPYRFLVNGQTGEVVGVAPWSFWKILFFVLFIIAVIVGIVMVLPKKQSSGNTTVRSGERSISEPVRVRTPRAGDPVSP